VDQLDKLDIFLHAKLSHFGWTAEAIIDLILAAICGGLVGLERELRGRQAGFRTNLLVCVGSALVMIVSNHVARTPWPSPQNPHVSINIDPARIAYGVMAGIGFLGAGTILKHGGSVRGLTTAAGLWCVAALGLAAGLGMYVVTVGATLLVLLALWLLDYFEDLFPRTHYRGIGVRCRWEPEAIGRVVEWLKGFGFNIVDVKFQRTADLKDVDVDVRVSFGKKQILYDLECKAQDVQAFHLMAIREA
jgi:putative Mg2+ transporter-C (MgtC) family protein